MKRTAIFLMLVLPLALAACGKGGGEDDAFAESIVQTFQADCQRITPANPKAAQKVRQLCACTTQKIRASGMKASDGDAVNNEKIHAAQRACFRQTYGRQA